MMKMRDETNKLNEMTEKMFEQLDKKLFKHYQHAHRETKEILFIIEEEFRTNGELKPSEIFRYNRINQLRNQLFSILQRMTGEEMELIEDTLTNIYIQNYLRSIYTIESHVEMNLDIERIDEDVVKIAATTLLSGIALSEHMDLGTRRFLNELQNEIVQGFILNESYRDMSKRVQKRFGMKMENSKRLVRSEGTRIQTQARMESYKIAEEKGIAIKKEWIASLDSRTRRSHRRLDGKIVGTDDYFEIGSRRAKAPGHFGVPAEDYNCRCTIAPVIDDETDLLRTDNEREFNHMNYEEWEKRYH